MTVPCKCEECGKPIDTGYIDIMVVTDDSKGLPSSVRLHSNGGCLGKYRLKYPLPPRSTIKV
jgi:hypothetical protein